MGVLICIVLFGWFLWEGFIRDLYTSFKYKKPCPIPVPEKMRETHLMPILEQKLKYPGQKGLYYDENGIVTIEGKYGYYGIVLDNHTLIVLRDTKENEEAACLEGYITKIFKSKAPINPHIMYKKMVAHRKRKHLLKAAPIVLVAALVLLNQDFNGGDTWKSNNISVSYLSEYSTEITVGQALDNFFSDGKWSTYKEGGLEYVDYTGTCLLNEEEVSVLIRFWSEDDEFRVDKVMIDGIEVSQITQYAMLEIIYEVYE